MNRRAEIRLLLGDRRLSFDRQDSSTEDELPAMLRLKANQSLFQSKFLLEWVAICSIPLPWWSYLYFFWSLEAADSEVEVLHAGSPDQTSVSHESGEIPVREALSINGWMKALSAGSDKYFFLSYKTSLPLFLCSNSFESLRALPLKEEAATE